MHTSKYDTPGGPVKEDRLFAEYPKRVGAVEKKEPNFAKAHVALRVI